MNNNKAVMEAALQMPRKQREDLYSKLLRSFIDPEVIRAGTEVADRRMQAYRRGEMGGKPVELVIQRLRQKKKTKS